MVNDSRMIFGSVFSIENDFLECQSRPVPQSPPPTFVFAFFELTLPHVRVHPFGSGSLPYTERMWSWVLRTKRRVACGVCV